MDKLSLYLEIVPLPVLLALVAGMAMAYLIMPAQTRFYVTFILMPAWLVAGRSPGLGAISAFAKISSPLLFMLVAVAALLRPGERRQIPGIAWMYLILAGYLLLCLIGVQRAGDNLVIQFQWIMLLCAALATVATLTTIRDIEILVDVLAVGLILALAIPLSAVALHPGEVFGKLGRFTPWDADPNQIGITLLLAAPILLYKGLTTRSFNVRLFMIALVLGAVGMALITGSRQIAFAMVVVLGLMCFQLLKRPGVVAFGLISGFIIIPFFWAMNPDAVNRLTSFDSSGRLAFWWEYLMLSIRRPLGLFGTSGLDAHYDPDIGAHPHSAFVEALYLGGWVYFLPLAILVVTGLKCAWRVWRARFLYMSEQRRFLIQTLAAILLSMYLQGIANQVIFHPTYVWSFLCVLLTVWFIAMDRELPELHANYLAEIEMDNEELAELEGADGYSHPTPA